MIIPRQPATRQILSQHAGLPHGSTKFATICADFWGQKGRGGQQSLQNVHWQGHLWLARMRRVVATLRFELLNLDKIYKIKCSKLFSCYFWKIWKVLHYFESKWVLCFKCGSISSVEGLPSFILHFQLGFVQYWMRGSIISMIHLTRPQLGSICCPSPVQLYNLYNECHWMPLIHYTVCDPAWYVWQHTTDAIYSRMPGSQKGYQQLGTSFCLGNYGNLTPDMNCKRTIAGA